MNKDRKVAYEVVPVAGGVVYRFMGDDEYTALKESQKFTRLAGKGTAPPDVPKVEPTNENDADADWYTNGGGAGDGTAKWVMNAAKLKAGGGHFIPKAKWKVSLPFKDGQAAAENWINDWTNTVRKSNEPGAFGVRWEKLDDFSKQINWAKVEYSKT